MDTKISTHKNKAINSIKRLAFFAYNHEALIKT